MFRDMLSVLSTTVGQLNFNVTEFWAFFLHYNGSMSLFGQQGYLNRPKQSNKHTAHKSPTTGLNCITKMFHVELRHIFQSASMQKYQTSRLAQFDLNETKYLSGPLLTSVFTTKFQVKNTTV